MLPYLSVRKTGLLTCILSAQFWGLREDVLMAIFNILKLLAVHACGRALKRCRAVSLVTVCLLTLVVCEVCETASVWVMNVECIPPAAMLCGSSDSL